jgi:hypothetical protein
MAAAIDRFQLQRATAGSGLIVALSPFPNDGIDLESAIYGNSSRAGGGGASTGRRSRRRRPRRR